MSRLQANGLLLCAAIIWGTTFVVQQVDRIGDARRAKILQRVTLIHQPQASRSAALNQVALDDEESIRWTRLINQLDPILRAAGDSVVANHHIERGT